MSSVRHDDGVDTAVCRRQMRVTSHSTSRTLAKSAVYTIQDKYSCRSGSSDTLRLIVGLAAANYRHMHLNIITT